MSPNPPPPAEWPAEINDLYSPIRVIGQGGFASVWMAKKKNEDGSDKDTHVAIKIMKNDGYAAREVAILSELSKKYSHPNIVRLLQHFQAKRGDAPKGSNACGVNVTVLSLARGPTLNHILNKFGGLGLVIAQTISRQLIDAVAFLHGHAVIHRDIQPSNMIVSGAQVNDDLWWDDNLDVDGKLANMAKQCHITLVDFGFARALGPKDIDADAGFKKVVDENEKQPEAPEGAKEFYASIDDALEDKTLEGAKETQSRGRSRTREDNFDTSISHKKIRDLSALGTRDYAAPEILSGIRNFAVNLNSSMSGKSRKKTLGTCVSDYGMDADAFSVGATIRYMVTGVPPSIKVEDFIASKNHPLKKIAKSLKKRIKKDTQKRAKKYRQSYDLPEDVNELIQILTHYNSRKRATVRSVTHHPWIEVSDPSSQIKGKESEHGGPVVYLKCGS